MPAIKEKMIEITEKMISANPIYQEKGIEPGMYPEAYLRKFKSKEEESKPSMDNLPSRRVLSVSERIDLEKTVGVYGYADASRYNDFRPGSSGFGAVDVPWINVNRVRLNEQQKQVKRVLDEGRPEPVAPEERDRLKALADELKEKFTDPEFFQTREEIRCLSRTKPEYFTALEKAQNWSRPQTKLKGRTPEQLANAYRNIMRRLEPDNPEADSLDRLRRSK